MSTARSLHPIDSTSIRTWHVRLAAKWRSDDLPLPIDNRAVELAARRRIRLHPGAGTYVAYFDIEAPTLASADRHLRVRWAEFVRDAKLPNWDLISLAIDEVSDDDHNPFRGHAPARRASEPTINLAESA